MDNCDVVSMVKNHLRSNWQPYDLMNLWNEYLNYKESLGFLHCAELFTWDDVALWIVETGYTAYDDPILLFIIEGSEIYRNF